MNVDGAMKNFFGSARHIDAIIIPPFDEKIAALKVDRYFPFSPVRQNSGNANR